MFNFLSTVFNIYVAGFLSVLGLLSGIHGIIEGKENPWKVFLVAIVFGMWAYWNWVEKANSEEQIGKDSEITLVRNYLSQLESGKEQISVVLKEIQSMAKGVDAPRYRKNSDDRELIEIYVRKKRFIIYAKDGMFDCLASK